MARLADQEQRSSLHVRTVQSCHNLQTLLEVTSARRRRVVATQCEDQSPEAEQVLLLQDVHIVRRCVIHQNIHDTARSDAKPLFQIMIQIRERLIKCQCGRAHTDSAQ